MQKGPVARVSAAAHLRSRREWGGRVPDERAHLMVQIMESWFLTQPCASNRYSDQKRKASGFSRGST